MLTLPALLCLATVAMTSSLCVAQSTSPNGVKTLNPPVAIKAEGTWSLGARAGDFVFVAGMQGIDPARPTLWLRTLPPSLMRVTARHTPQTQKTRPKSALSIAVLTGQSLY